MASISEIIAAMKSAGVSAEKILAVIEQIEAEKEAQLAKNKQEKREKARIRKQNQRQRDASRDVTQCHAMSQDVTHVTRDSSSSPDGFPPHPPSLTPSSSIPPDIPPKGDISSPQKNKINLLDGFDEFWDAYAHKVGKQAAIKVWKAKQLCRIKDDVVAGAVAYAKARGPDPAYWKHPQGWLSAGRWEDEQDQNPRPAWCSDEQWNQYQTWKEWQQDGRNLAGFAVEFIEKIEGG